MKKYILPLIAFIAFAVGNAQIDRSKQPESGPAPIIQLEDPETIILKNGLTLLLVENHKLPQVSISLNIDSPLVVEGEKTGANSLLTAMLGKGSQTISKNDFEEEIDFLGAHFHFNSDGAHASALTRYFPRVLTLMADAALHPNFLAEEFEKEKEKTLTSIETSELDVKTAARRVENLVSYGPNHPYGEYMSKESVTGLNLNDIKNAYTELYNPQNAYITVVGDFDATTIKKQMNTAFGKWQGKKVTTPSIITPENTKATEIIFVEMPNAVQSEIAVMNTVTLNKKNPDYFSVLLANQILGGGAEARLFLNLREDKGFTYGAYSQMRDSHKTKGLFRASTSVRNAVTDSAVVEMINEVDRLALEPISDEELELVKAKYAGNFVISLENPETIAQFAYNIKTQNLGAHFYRNFLQNINAVSKEDIQRVANKYFLSNNARIVVTGKGSDILKPLENITFKGQKLTVDYRDKYGNKIERPDYNKAAPEGITAASVIEGYLNAIGGREKLKAIKSVEMESEATMQGMKLEFISKKTDQKQSLVEVKVMGNVMQKQVVNKDYAYMEMQGQRMDITGDPLQLMIEEAALFMETQLNSDMIKFVGMTDVGGKNAYEIKISDAQSNFYDAESFLKIQSVQTVEMMGTQQTTTTKFGEYKAVDGILYPHVFSMSMGPQEIEFTTSSIVFNSELDPILFK